MSTVKERLKEVMDTLGLKPLTPASTCDGITKNMMYKLWQSETDNVSSNILEPFCKKYSNVNCNYLIRGEGKMFLGVEKDTQEKCSNESIEFLKGQIAAYKDAFDRIGHGESFKKGIKAV